MKFKHIALSGFIALSLICAGAYSVSFAAADNTISDSVELSADSNKESMQVPQKISDLLQILGLMEESEINSDGYVKRDAAAEIILRFEKIFTEGTATGKVYNDVTAENSYAYEIETSTELGYFLGTGNGKFAPDDYITSVQMATVLMRFAGYRTDYIPSSAELSKLLKNTGNSEYLTYYGLAYMIYNFLDTYIVESNAVFEGGFEYTQSETETILNNCFDIYKFKGVITENDITGLWSGSDIRKNCVSISGTDKNIVILTGETDIASMIGRYVEVYYKYDKDENTSVCLYYTVPDYNNKITEIDLYEIDYISSTDTKIEYYPQGGKRSKVKYDRGTAIIYNGTYYADTVPVLNKVNGKEGKITAIDNNGDGKTDVLNVEAYDTYVVNSVVLSDSVVHLKNNQSIKLDKDDYDRFSIKDENGNDAFIEDFVQDTVLSVAKNDDAGVKKVIKVLVAKQKTSGVVTNVYKNDLDKDVIELDGISDYVLSNNAVTLPDIGQGVVLLLNAFGNVAMIDYSNAGGFAYGIITRVWMNEGGEAVMVRMITAQNTIEEFEVRDKLTVDKSSYKNKDRLYEKLHNEDNVLVGEFKLPAGVYPVRYRLKSDGTLAEIDTSTVGANEDGNTLELLASGKYSEKGGVLGGVFAVKDSTPVFKVKGISNSGTIDISFFEDTKYTTMSDAESTISSNGKYQCAAYKVENDSFYADFVVIYSSWASYDYSDKLLVVEKIRTVYDETTDEVLKSIHGVQYGFEKDIVVSDFYQNTFDEMGIGPGDVIRYTTDVYNQLIDIEDDSALLKHTKDSEGKYNGIEINNISSGRTTLDNFKNDSYATQVVFGYVLERRDNFVKLSVITPGSKIDGARAREDMEKETVLIQIPDSATITVYDPSKSEKVYTATYDEILDYMHSGMDCSLVAMHFRSASLLEVVVLNDYDLFK